MPTCPGCQQRVSYDRLADHLHNCPALRGSAAAARPDVDRLTGRVDALERRLRAHEAEMARSVEPLDETGDGDDSRLLQSER